jgi:hypothetical protein
MAKITIDFSSVSDAPKIMPVRQPEGLYEAEVVSHELTKTKSDNTDMLLYVIKAGRGTYPYYVKLVPNQLWKLRELLVSCGMDVPKKSIQLDPAKLVGKKLNVYLAPSEYQGKEKSEIESTSKFEPISRPGVSQAETEDQDDVVEDYDFDEIM